MELWHIWVLVALVFFIIEIFTSGFAVACFSIGALGSAVAAACGLSILWQMVIFAILSIIALITVRPLVVKLFFKKDEDYKTNGSALIGRHGRVSEAINPSTGKGRVAIDGDDWKAVSAAGTAIAKGTEVEVVSIDSVIVTVKTL